MSIIKDLQTKNKEELLKETLEKVKTHQAKCNSFVTILEDAKITEKKESLLANIPYALKDNFSTKGILTTASSNTLKNYIPPYSATVYERLCAAGAICIGKTVMDEFGMGGTGKTGHTGIVKNPHNLECIAGGSSAGNAASVADGVIPFAIGSDTGDSIRKPAAYCGCVGYKPTYGMISRYGLFAFASSLDHVGVFTRSVEDAAIVADIIKGKDEHDMTSWDSSDIHLTEEISKERPFKLFTIKEILESPEMDQDVYEEYQKTIFLLQSHGIQIETVSIDKELLDVLPSVYTSISCAEATSNLSNLTGIIFGPRGEGKNVTEMMKDHRTKGFSPLIKRRLVIGSYVLQRENQEKYFVNAQRIRNRIVNIMKEYFKTYDACILPCSGHTAPKIEDAKDMMSHTSAILENHMVIGNFGGFPSISIPNAMVHEMPTGINFTANQKEDAKLLNLAYLCEKWLKEKEEEE